jgi:hypothetical protein
MMKKGVRQHLYKLKKKFFNACPLHMVPKASPLKWMTGDQWDTLVAYWKNEKKL